MHAAVMRFELRSPESHSLKAKRAAIKPIVEGLRVRFRVSVAETGHQDLWQRAELGVAVVAESHRHLEAMLESVRRFVEAARDLEVLDVETTYLEER